MSSRDFGSSSSSPRSLRGLRVLSIENANRAQEVLTPVLKRYGAAVTTATSIGEALDAIERERPEVIVGDLSLASRVAYDLIRAVRRMPPERGGATPAVALGSTGRSSERDNALAAGFTEHVTPERLISLLAHVRSRAGGSGDVDHVRPPTLGWPERVFDRLSELETNGNRLDALLNHIRDRRARTPNRLETIQTTLGNRLLDVLPSAEAHRMREILEPVRLSQGELLCTAGDLCQYAYFPTTSIVSHVWLMESGKSVEVMAVGRDGFVGLPFVFDARSSPHWWRVTVAGDALRVDPSALHQTLQRCPELRRLLMGWAQFQFVEISQAVACRRIHTIEHQVARWLLAMRDRSGSPMLRVTHEAIAELLGTRRAGVSVVMEGFRRNGLIASQRGNVRILDLRGLRAVACECYDTLNREFDLLFHRNAGAA